MFKKNHSKRLYYSLAAAFIYCIVFINIWLFFKSFISVQFSHSVTSDSLRPRELWHARPPCPLPTPGVHPNPCPSSRWCHPTISSSVVPFSSCPQSFPASGYFPMSQLFASGGQSIGVSASISVLPVNTQDWFPLGWTGWISLQSKGLSRVLSNTKSINSSGSCRQHIYRPWFCICSASLWLLVGVFNLFIFKVIINIQVPNAILLIVLDLFL